MTTRKGRYHDSGEEEEGIGIEFHLAGGGGGFEPNTGIPLALGQIRMGGGLPSSQIYCYGGEYHLYITAELHTIHLIILAWGGRSSIHVHVYIYIAM